MKHRAIVTVARLRRLALDDASQAVSRALAAEVIAATRADDATQQIADEAAAASTSTATTPWSKRLPPGCQAHGSTRLRREKPASAPAPRLPGCAPC